MSSIPSFPNGATRQVKQGVTTKERLGSEETNIQGTALDVQGGHLAERRGQRICEARGSCCRHQILQTESVLTPGLHVVLRAQSCGTVLCALPTLLTESVTIMRIRGNRKKLK